jgi:hypothetical protein
MQKIVIVVLVVLAGAACKKNNDGYNANSLAGGWRYTTSIIDSGNNRTSTGYDNSVGPDLGDTLRFLLPDTVRYTYMGSTTWSNYQVRGNSLILIGSANRDTLTIYSVTAAKLQIGWPANNSSVSYRMNFEKFNP